MENLKGMKRRGTGNNQNTWARSEIIDMKGKTVNVNIY